MTPGMQSPGVAGQIDSPAPGPAFLESVDIAIIGAGVVGAAIARELSAYQLSTAIIEAREDVGTGSSKANTGILHTGFNTVPGTLESQLVRRGYELLSDYAPKVGIPIERVGGLVIAWNPQERSALPSLLDQARANGYHASALIDAPTLYSLVPALGPGALGALTVPDEAIVCPWTTTLAFATESVLRGTRLLLNAVVHGINVGPDSTIVQTSRGAVQARWVINAAGVGAGIVDQLFGFQRLSLTTKSGQYLVMDKLGRGLVPHILMSVRQGPELGTSIAPTVYGSVIVGPQMSDVSGPTVLGTTEHALADLSVRGHQVLPGLMAEEVTSAFAGIAASTGQSDYLISLEPAQRYVLIAGVRNTGITSAMGIAEFVSGQLGRSGVNLVPRTDLPAHPRLPNIGEAFPRAYSDGNLIARDPAYGHIVCFCERATAGEIRDALSTPIPPVNSAGLARRTRAGNGRCQGALCGAELESMFVGHDSLEHTAEALDPAAPKVPTGQMPQIQGVPAGGTR